MSWWQWMLAVYPVGFLAWWAFIGWLAVVSEYEPTLLKDGFNAAIWPINFAILTGAIIGKLAR